MVLAVTGHLNPFSNTGIIDRGSIFGGVCTAAVTTSLALAALR
jgi:hypothetical protein